MYNTILLYICCDEAWPEIKVWHKRGQVTRWLCS